MSTKNMTWYDVTLNQFEKLQKCLEIEDKTEQMISVAEVLLGDDITNLPIKEFNDNVKQLSFLNEEMPTKNHPPKKVEINGRKYFMDCLLGNITTAQYVDYTNHSVSGDVSKMLSVFVIPEGHKYNDGYDMLQVIEDIRCLPIPVVNTTAFFFSKQLNKFMEIFQHYSIRKIKKAKIAKNQKEELIKLMEKSMDLV